MAALQRQGELKDADLYRLLDFIDQELAPAMSEYGYRAPVIPIDLIYGLSGCHSSFAGLFEETAREKQVDLYQLIVKVSAIDQKAPTAELIRRIADEMRE